MEGMMVGRAGFKRLEIIRGFFLLALALVIPRNAAANLLVNGSFETGPFAGSFVNLPGGNTSITGWTVTGEGIDYIGTLWVSADGIHSLDLDGSVASTTTPPFVHGGIAQTFATTPGTSYLVTFDLAGNPFSGPTIKPLLVLAAGQQANFTFDITGKSAGSMGWLPETWTFIANSSSTTLEFRSLTVSPLTGFGPALDNVSVDSISVTPPNVPEPAPFLLLGFGLIALSAWARRRR
jgi:choice-of-anchor C domain-containing protein